MANVGTVGLDWQERVNWDRLRKYRLERARERMKAHGLGALLLMYDENIRWSYAWIKGAAGAASTQQVTKFTNAIKQEMKKRGVDGLKLGVDFIDINMIRIFKDSGIDWTDGMTPMMEARAV